MLPLRDDIPSRRYPVMTVLLIAVNGVAFLWELGLGWRLEDALLLLGIIPVRYTVGEVSALFSWREQLLPFVTSMFLHGGWTHLLGNMWTLWIFGDNVEDRLGRGRYLALYLLGGVAAALLHIFTNANSPVPTIGASGAIAGVMGAYFRLYPHARVEMVIPPFFSDRFLLCRGGVSGLVVHFAILQRHAEPLASPATVGGIAWWAHIGGFVFGALLCSVVKVRRFYQRRYEDEDMPW